MHWTIKCARSLLLLMPALALAMPAFAQDRDPRLSDSQEPRYRVPQVHHGNGGTP
jgi:hypothetical protein